MIVFRSDGSVSAWCPMHEVDKAYRASRVALPMQETSSSSRHLLASGCQEGSADDEAGLEVERVEQPAQTARFEPACPAEFVE